MAVHTKLTRDHREIQHWVQERDGRPGVVRTSEDPNAPVTLEVDFPGHSGEQTVQSITWEEFFDHFDREQLLFAYKDDTTSGEVSFFCKIVDQQHAGRFE
jgi:hypothetical protein